MLLRMDSKGVISRLIVSGFEIQPSLVPTVTCPFISIGSSQPRSWVSFWFCFSLFAMAARSGVANLPNSAINGLSGSVTGNWASW